MGTLRKWLVAVVILLVAAGLVWLGLRHGHARERVLADGSVLRLAKVHFGKEEPYQITNFREDMEGWTKKWLPKAWTKNWFKPPPASFRGGRTSWSMVSVSHTNSDALWMYFTRRMPGSTNYQNVDLQSAEILDSHDCLYLPTRMGGFDDGRLARNPMAHGGQGTVEWFLFEAFPRHEKTFRLRIYDERHNLATEFAVENPACTPMRPTNWQVEPLPISKTTNHATFVLTGVDIKPKVATVQPTFRCLENGAPTTAWKASDAELWDSSGNFAQKLWGTTAATRLVSPYEPAWKLRVNFYGSEATAGASNVVWKISKVKAPGAGEYLELDDRRTIFFDEVDVLTLAGPGKITYSNEVPIKATPELPLGTYPISHLVSGNDRMTGAYFTMQDVGFTTSHIAMYIRGLKNDGRLTICATDEQGRRYYAYDWVRRMNKTVSSKPEEINYLDTAFKFGSKISFYQLDLPADCKMVDLTVCVHYPVVEEFVFKPPTMPGKK